MLFVHLGRTDDLQPIYNILQILKVENVFYLESSKYMYKLKNDLLPITIGNYFEDQSSRLAPRYYNMRNMRELPQNISPRLLSGEKSMQFRGEILWSEISDSSKNSNSLNTFKKRIKSNLLKS